MRLRRDTVFHSETLPDKPVQEQRLRQVDWPAAERRAKKKATLSRGPNQGE